MKKLFTLLAFVPASFLFSQTCNLLNHSCANTVGLNTNGVTANAGATVACTIGNYVLYSTGTNPYIATDDLLVNPGNAATLHFKSKRSTTYTGTGEIWAHVGGYCTFGVYTSPSFNNNGWVQIGTFNPTTTCATYGPFTVPSDIIGGNMISYCMVLKNASTTNWVSVDDICVSQITGATVPTTYTETFGTSATGWYPQTGYVSVPYHTYKNASDAYVILGTGQAGGTDKAAYFYTGFDFCSTVSGTGITTREINTAGYTNGEVRISFKSRYPCSGTLNYTFDEDYTSYSPEVFIMEGPDDGSNSWIPLPVNYYFSDYTWRVASYDISAYKNSNVRIKVERGGFCGTAMEAVDNIKVLDRNCAISLLSCGTITGETNPLPATQYAYSVPAVTGATYYKWFVRSAGNLYDTAPYIVSGQGTQNVTIDFGALPAAGLRVLCIPYDADPSVVADACYAQIGYLGVTLTTPASLNVDVLTVNNITCYGANNGIITMNVSGGLPPYTYAWTPNVSSSDAAYGLSMGSYQIIITDQNGDQTIANAFVVEPDPLVINNLMDATVCAGETFTTNLNVTGGTGGYTYSWAPLFVSDATVLNPVFSPPSSINYNLNVTDGAGCPAFEMFSAYVNPLPVVELGADQGICPGTSITLNAGTDLSQNYTWNTTETTNEISVAASGIYFVTVTSALNCVSTDTIELFDSALPVVDLGIDQTICHGDTITLTAGADLTNTYDWSTGESTNNISASSQGIYSVTVINADNCSATDAFELFHFPTTLQLGGPYDFCEGGSHVLDAGAGFTAYDWNTSATSQTISVNTSGQYSVGVIDINGCEETDTVLVNEVQYPLVDLGEKINTCEEDGPVILSAGSGYDDYLWSTGETTETISVNTSGSYWVQVSEGPCERADTVVVLITDCLGISENGAANAIKIYPNPVNTLLHVENIPQNATLFVYDISGKIMFAKPAVSSSCILTTELLVPGMYLLVIIADDNVMQKSFVRE